MYVHWRSLISFGLAIWGLLCCTDFLGESTWKRCSSHVDDILKGQYNELTKMHQNIKPLDLAEAPKQKMNWPMLLWNVCAFLCSLVFCSVIRSMSWVVWKLFKIYNVFRNRKVLTNKLTSGKITDDNTIPEAILENKHNTKILFKNQMFACPKQEQDHINLTKELEELKSEKEEIAEQLILAQKENLTARQQIEEFKLENFMMKEKLTRTANTLKENLKHKDFANVNHDMIVRKAQTLETHLKEVSRDRDLLRNKLTSLEKNYTKIEEQLKMYEKQQDSETNLEQFPEKDTNKPVENNVIESEVTELTENPDIDICKFQKKIIALQKSIGTYEPKKIKFNANSKISMDLEESSLSTSKENDSEVVDCSSDSKKADINIVKQNILNYNAYKAQMLRPKVRLANIKERLYTQAADTTGSSSDDNNCGPHRIISSTAEFQNFLKTLTSNSASSVNFRNKFF